MGAIDAGATPKPIGNLFAIVAACDDWGIGLDGGMLVANKADMRHFVRHTKGHTVLMGRRTLDSFPGGRPLVDRRNVIVTRDKAFGRTGVEVAHTLDEALRMVATDDEVWVIGGGQVYSALLPLCSHAVVTRNHCVREADTFFPDLGADPSWTLTRTVGNAPDGRPLVTAEGIPFEFETYERF